MAQTLYGLPVAEQNAAAGSLVTEPGQLQYGQVLLGVGTAAGWRELFGWRDLPDASTNDTPRPQAHGSYPGDVFGEPLTVTYTFLLRGAPDDKAAAVELLERYLPLDGVERHLVVDDGRGPEYRLARVIGRQVPQGIHYRHAPLECSVQFLCADPRRYSLAEHAGTVSLPLALGGLSYPLEYPLVYGEQATTQFSATNAGSAAAPLRATFVGPLTNPTLACPAWRIGFDITLAEGESLVVDTSEGTALLDGLADRLHTIQTDADPLERCLLAPGTTTLTLTAEAGQGHVQVAYHDARM